MAKKIEPRVVAWLPKRENAIGLIQLFAQVSWVNRVRWLPTHCNPVPDFLLRNVTKLRSEDRPPAVRPVRQNRGHVGACPPRGRGPPGQQRTADRAAGLDPAMQADSARRWPLLSECVGWQ